MLDNANPNTPPNNPHYVPTLADKQIDLAAFQLVDFDQEEICRLPKPHAGFTEIVRQALSIYPDFQAELKLADEDFDPDKVAEHLDLAEQLIPYADWLERRAEQVRETRMAHLADAYRPVLKLYQRIQAAAEFNPQVGYAFAFLAEHFGAGKKKSKKE